MVETGRERLRVAGLVLLGVAQRDKSKAKQSKAMRKEKKQKKKLSETKRPQKWAGRVIALADASKSHYWQARTPFVGLSAPHPP